MFIIALINLHKIINMNITFNLNLIVLICKSSIIHVSKMHELNRFELGHMSKFV